ncbi:diketogulonate reductase-like aldo/keto reductase [Okibacterium sp. HSC-33S16]|uniref:aldo/keto reductase n=1 Tax=Okibacterium sp. HSC-33S16 TaxID=2910965 RepID=UPI00209FAB53|nr:aldo/keto reductase [Okibacterium sp. HSC-33S16]MCP2031875.1 diketogulonate reductase-like aldo/keto reductase [Okibacterium sp. HSC-33S16]
MTLPAPHLLNDGSQLPAIGFGTYPLTGSEGADAVSSALEIGYRLIDTAVNYGNEDVVGRAIAASDVPRSEIVVTTKLPGRDHGYDETLRSFEASAEALGLETIDLYLIHWPNPSVGKFAESWKAMVQLQKDHRVRSIGVSNFTEAFLERLGAETGVLPAVNQIEVHPYFPQDALVEYHREHGILTEAWSPLGKRAAPYQEQVIADIANAHGITPTQAVLRWHVQRGIVPLPKSANPERQRSNFEMPGDDLTVDEIAAITALGKPDGRLFGGDPNTHEEM